LNLEEMKKEVFALIEEYDKNSPYLTADVDLQAKVNGVINHVMYELARIKKIPKYFEMEVQSGQLVTLEEMGNECGYEIYQLGTVGGEPTPQDFYIVKNGVGQKQDSYVRVGGQLVKQDEYLT
jgi:hypothetical protein